MADTTNTNAEGLAAAPKPKTRKTRSADTYAKQAGTKKNKFPKTKANSRGFKGAAFVHKLWVTMTEKGEAPKDLAAFLGVAYSYLMLLAKGERDPSGLPLDKIRKAAEYMGIPMAQAALMAEAMIPTDFFLEVSIAERMEIVYRDFQADPLYGGFAPKPEEWQAMPPSVKLAMAVLYENASKTQYLPHASLVRVVEKP